MQDEVQSAWRAQLGPVGEHVLSADGNLVSMLPHLLGCRVASWVAGESFSWGGMGWVAPERVADLHLLWMVTSDISNPFVAVRFDGAFVEADSTFGKRWRFRLTEPTSVTISGFGRRPD